MSAALSAQVIMPANRSCSARNGSVHLRGDRAGLDHTLGNSGSSGAAPDPSGGHSRTPAASNRAAPDPSGGRTHTPAAGNRAVPDLSGGRSHICVAVTNMPNPIDWGGSGLSVKMPVKLQCPTHRVASHSAGRGAAQQAELFLGKCSSSRGRSYTSGWVGG